MTKGLNIVSRLTFENIPDGALPTSIPDENKYSTHSYTKYTNVVNVETVDGIKFIKLASATSNSKIYAQNVIIGQSKKNFQAEFDVIFDSISTEMTLVAIGSSNTLTTMLRVVAYADPTKGIALVNDIRSINSYYKFETNKKYTICVGMKDNVISMYINGTIIGYSYSETFTNNLNVVTPASIILGSTALVNAGASGGMLTGKLGNINISSGPSVKHEESYTKYGTNLVSFLNFENLAGIGTYKAGLEAVYEGIEWRGVESATYSKGYGNINNISTDITGEFTVKFSLKKFKVINANILKYGNYSVDYIAGFIPVPDPDVIVNDYTTAALNFENGLVDQIGTTIWQKEGTADVTSVNKIFGENSFETKVLGDSLYTNSNIITGGATPFTIEFYALIKGSESSNGNYVAILLTATSPNAITIGRHKVNGNLVFYRYTNIIDKTSNKKIFFNEINKFLISYDGAALRIFINNEFDMVVGINDITWYDKTWFLRDIVDNRNHYGLIDNINIHDGIATKVRDTDPYEEFLMIDLALDGENNSTKIVDNGNGGNTWTVYGNAKLSTSQKFDGFSSLYLNGSSSIYTHTTDNHVSFNRNSIFTMSFDYICTVADTSTKVLVQFFNNSSQRISLYMHSLKNLKLYYSGALRFDINIPTIEVNTPVNYRFIWDKGTIYLYINNVLVHSYYENYDMLDGYPFRIYLGESGTSSEFFYGYIKNFKIYKDVAVIPENSTGKIQLDFDNNVVDKYGNSTWTNNGVTFDQVNSIKGHSAYFNQTSSRLTSGENNNFNFENKDFLISCDIKRTIPSTSSNILTSGATSYPTNWVEIFCRDGIIGYNNQIHNYSLEIPLGLPLNNYYSFDLIHKNTATHIKVNDVVIGTEPSKFITNNFNANNNTVIGGSLNNGSQFGGYIDNFKSYKEDFLNNVDIYKTNESSTITISGDMLRLYSTVSNGIWFKNKDCPNVKDFIFKTTIIKTFGEQSIILRTSNWRNVNDTFAYLVVINGATIGLAKGSNSLTTTSFSWLKQSTALDSTLTKYNIEIIANDNNIKIYCNDVLYIDYTGSDYLNSGRVGFRSYGEADYKIDYYSIEDLNNNILYYKDWKSKVNNAIDKPAVHLPLETNAINTGFTPLTINSIGNPTYTTIDGKKCIKFESGKYLTINSNNIFNLGTSSDFCIEMRIYVNNYTLPNRIFASTLNSENSRIGLGSITSNYYKKLYINAKDLSDYPSINECLIDHWNDIKIYRKNQKLTILLNGVISEYNVDQKEFDFSSTFIGGTTTTYFDGYMSNFKMFVGTSEIPETYNDKKVLDLDFNPTGKSYLFKDNNNKCIIHPVNITQRDYQDSQYCCTFNGVDQYLQLGKNDLFNFGNDDFVIEFYFRVIADGTWNILLGNGATVADSNYHYIGVSENSHSINPSKVFLQIGTLSLISFNQVTYDDINHLLIYRQGNTFTIVLNGVETTSIIDSPTNFNYNGETQLGSTRVSNWVNHLFKGSIYSIKVLRNTTDLSLLENENTDVIIGDTTLTLSNGTDSQEVIFDNKDQNDFRFVHSNDSTKLIVNEQILEVPNVENELNELSLFTDFNAEAKDIKTYNIAFEDEDTFSGNIPIHTQFGEIEEISTLSDEFIVVDQGDFIVKGFFEGRPEDSRYQIQNRFDKFIVHTGSGPFNYNGLNERYIDDYEIYLPDTKETMPIPTEPMIRGYITVSITPTECDGINFGVKVFRRSDNKLIGIYDFNNYICTIDNLDCNKRYDCIIFDQDVNLESRCLSNRTPIPY